MSNEPQWVRKTIQIFHFNQWVFVFLFFFYFCMVVPWKRIKNSRIAIEYLNYVNIYIQQQLSYSIDLDLVGTRSCIEYIKYCTLNAYSYFTCRFNSRWDFVFFFYFIFIKSLITLPWLYRLMIIIGHVNSMYLVSRIHRI